MKKPLIVFFISHYSERGAMIECFNEATSKCPKYTRQRIARILDWTNAVSNNIGSCSYQGETCDPEGALKDMYMMGEYIVNEMDIGVCA